MTLRLSEDEIKKLNNSESFDKDLFIDYLKKQALGLLEVELERQERIKNSKPKEQPVIKNRSNLSTKPYSYLSNNYRVNEIDITDFKPLKKS